MVFRFGGRLTITNVKVRGSRAVALLAHRDVEVTGLLDVSADGSTSGPGSQGGGCVGQDSHDAGGSGGAGMATIGGHGGRGGSTRGHDYGGACRALDGRPLVGGAAGGRNLGTSGAVPTILGGGGGGAVQLVSRVAITLHNGGKIDAGGGGGMAHTRLTAGTGGGSGGIIVLEAPGVTLDGSSGDVVIGAR